MFVSEEYIISAKNVLIFLEKNKYFLHLNEKQGTKNNKMFLLYYHPQNLPLLYDNIEIP